VTATGINTQKTTQTIKTGSLKVISIPSGATIRVDNQALSVPTDASVSDVSIGKHTVSVSFPSLSPLQISVMLEAGQTITITADFENMSIRSDATYNLNISSVPSEAKVAVDDQEVGVTPVTLKLSQGVHNLSVKKDGYKQYQEKLNVESHDFKKVELQEVGSLIRFTTDMANTTIPKISATNSTFSWEKDYYISSGKHTISYAEFRHDVNFENMHSYVITVKALQPDDQIPLFTMDNLPGKKAIPIEPTYKQDWKYEVLSEVRPDDSWGTNGMIAGGITGLLIAFASDYSIEVKTGIAIISPIVGAIVGMLFAPQKTYSQTTDNRITLEVVQAENRKLQEAWREEYNAAIAYNKGLLDMTNSQIEAENRARATVNNGRGVMIIKDITNGKTTTLRIGD
jgi:gas vesicle protein